MAMWPPPDHGVVYDPLPVYMLPFTMTIAVGCAVFVELHVNTQLVAGLIVPADPTTQEPK